MATVKWDGVETHIADRMYQTMSKQLGAYGKPRNRGNATNKNKSCKCNDGVDGFGGASYTFGCSWSNYYSCCKWGYGELDREINKFELLNNPGYGSTGC